MRRLLLAVLGLMVAACGSGAGPDVAAEAPSTTATPRPSVPSGDDPPTVLVRAGDLVLALAPWTWCYGGVCADGMRPAELPSLGEAGEAIVELPLEGWDVLATFAASAEACTRQDTVELERRSPATFRLVPVGPAGDHVVDLFARGQGDVLVSFRWRTTVDAPSPPPEATVSVLADHDGVVDSYGVELDVRGLRTTPAEARASITVTSASGASTVLEPGRRPAGCDDGTVGFAAPAAAGQVAAGLGDGPFTYEVRLVLDGADHVATASWPDDEDDGCAPCVPLRFDPPLPGRG